MSLSIDNSASNACDENGRMRREFNHLPSINSVYVAQRCWYTEGA